MYVGVDDLHKWVLLYYMYGYAKAAQGGGVPGSPWPSAARLGSAGGSGIRPYGLYAAKYFYAPIVAHPL